MVDLKEGMVTGTGQQIDLETGEAGLHSTPLVVKDVVIVGSSFKEGMTVVTHNNTKGLVRAFDVRTGKLLWTFNTIPRPGEFGNETWENGSWATNGNTGVWTQMTVDEELGLGLSAGGIADVGLLRRRAPGRQPVRRKPGLRRSENRQAQVAFPDRASPDLGLRSVLRADSGGHQCGRQSIKAVALPSKEAFLYVFDRVTGQPVWPIEERPVPQSDVPGEKTSPTQPFPTKPPAYARNYIKVPDDLIDFTPEMRAQAQGHRRALQDRADVPAADRRRSQRPARRDESRQRQRRHELAGRADTIPKRTSCTRRRTSPPYRRISLRTPPPGFSDIRYVLGTERHGVPRSPKDRDSAAPPMRRSQPVRAGGGQAAAAPGGAAARRLRGGGLTVQGLSIVKPPYGVISAINLDRGDIQWQVPYGETPDAVRNHPALKGKNIGNTGQGGSVGLLVTKTLVILGDSQMTSTPQHPRGAMLRAYDKATGKEVGAV